MITCFSFAGDPNAITLRAQKLGKTKGRTAYEEFVAKALVGGAGLGHKLAKADSALPPLRLVFKEVKSGETTFITEPREVAIRHSKPWETIWNANDIHFDSTVVPFFRNLRQYHLSTAHQAANEMGTRPETMRATLKQFSGKTAIVTDQQELAEFRSLAAEGDAQALGFAPPRRCAKCAGVATSKCGTPP